MSNPNPNVETRFKPGQSGNPGGIPRGRSMKTYWRNKFMKMTDDEIEEWCKKNKVAGDVIWRMGEGQPTQGLDGGEDDNGNRKSLLGGVSTDGSNNSTQQDNSAQEEN